MITEFSDGRRLRIVASWSIFVIYVHVIRSFNLLDKLWRKHSQFLIVITNTVTGSKHCFTDSCKMFVDR